MSKSSSRVGKSGEPHWASPLGGIIEARRVLQQCRKDVLAEKDRNSHLKGVYEPVLAALEPALGALAALDQPRRAPVGNVREALDEIVRDAFCAGSDWQRGNKPGRYEDAIKPYLDRSSQALVSVHWRPIESAPKDGTVIDVWREEGGRETVSWGLPPHDCGEMGQYCDSDWHSEKEPGWVCNTFGEFVGGKHNPFTHWMPLPAAPPLQATGEE